MKRLVVAAVALFCFLLYGCGSQQEDESKSPTALFETTGFDDAIHNNPIDKAFDALELGASTWQMVQECMRFTAYWNAEIDNTVEKLCTFLHEEDAEALKLAQQAWREYMDAHYHFLQSLLESFRPDDTAWHYGIANGTLDWGLANTRYMDETRARAFELMEYYYRFTGEVCFVFEKSCE